MLVGIVTRDQGPWKLICGIEEVLRADEKPLIVPWGPETSWLDYGGSLAECDVVLTAFSSVQHAQEEVPLVESLGKIPASDRPKIIVIEDLPGNCIRPKTQGVVQYVDGLIVASEGLVDEARKFGYTCPITAITPWTWGEQYKAMTELPNICGVLRKEGDEPLEEDDVLIFVFGGAKNPAHNNALLQWAIEHGCAEFGEHAVFHFVPHTGEERSVEVADELKPELADRRQEMLDEVTLLSEADEYSDAELVKAADIVVITGGPAIILTSALARQAKMVYPNLTELGLTDDELAMVKEGYRTMRERMSNQGIPGGLWKPVELGAAYYCEQEDGERVFHGFSDGTIPAELLSRQVANFTVPDDWDTARAAAAFITKVTAG